MTVGQLLKHDFSKGSLYLYDSNGNEIYTEFSDRTWYKQDYDNNGNVTYYESSYGYWYKQDYDNNSNEIYFETSNGYWSKSDYDSNGNRIYYENSNGRLIVSYKRPKKDYCNGKVVEIDGKKYKLTEV